MSPGDAMNPQDAYLSGRADERANLLSPEAVERAEEAVWVVLDAVSPRLAFTVSLCRKSAEAALRAALEVKDGP